MRLKFISNDAYDQELLSFNIKFPELTNDDLNLEDIAFGEFTIAQYTEDGQIYAEITFSDTEKEKIYRWLI